MKEENIDEVAPLLAAPLIAKGLMALKGTKAVTTAVKGAAAFKKGLTTAKAVGAAGKITTSGGKLAAGAKKVGLAQKAGQYTRSGLAAMKNNPMSTALDATSLKPGHKMPNAPMDPRQKMTGARTAGVYASADLFDIVKGQLLDEGIDEKDALKIMLELSQQDLDIIVNEGLAGNVARLTAAGTVAAMGVNTIRQMNKKKEKMDAGGKFTPGSTMDNIQKKNQAIRDAGM